MRLPVRTSTTVLLLFAVAGCTDSDQKMPLEPATLRVPVYGLNAESRKFKTKLDGDNEVPAQVVPGKGHATFKLSKDGTTLHYKLFTNKVSEITQAHIHIAAEGVNGPVVVFLFDFVPEGVENSGLLAEGDIVESDLIPRPAIGFGGTMAELLEAMRTGNAYVNVHTVTLAAGEIRGQID